MSPPRIIITSGEPAGIGPDLCIALAQQQWPCELVFAMDPELLQTRCQQLNVHLQQRLYQPGIPCAHQAGTFTLLPITTTQPVIAGQLNSAQAHYVLRMLDAAADGCLRGDFAAMVTAPLHKGIINAAGIPFSGHTEYLATRTGCTHPVMLLTTDTLKVALVTTHLPLNQVSAALTPALLQQVITVLHHDLQHKFKLPTPRILVLGLNPHAGESGYLGQEEITVITPILEALRAQGMLLYGPVPADTAFTPHQLANIDVVLAMYHDQGLPVLKYAGFGQAVNVTLGLPIIRTSVDHGTALSLAASGQAQTGSLRAALKLAITLAQQA